VPWPAGSASCASFNYTATEVELRITEAADTRITEAGDSRSME